MKQAILFVKSVSSRLKSTMRATIALALSTFQITVIIFAGPHLTSVQAQQGDEDPCRFVRIEKWVGSFSLEGSGTGHAFDETYTISQSITGTFSVTEKVSPFNCSPTVWREGFKAGVSINDKFVGDDGGSLTYRGSGEIVGNFNPDPTPIGNGGAKLEIDPVQGLYNFSVDQRFPVKLTTVSPPPNSKTGVVDYIYSWGPNGGIGLNINDSLPKSGAVLSGKKEFKDFLDPFSANWVLKWEIHCDPSDKPLSVGSLFQYSLPWRDDKLFKSDQTIWGKGCALTALTMALNYPAGSINPRSLNNLLITNDAGFNGVNLLFDVATRLASGNARKFHAFESGSTNDNIEEALCQGLPAIVRVDVPPGHHYVVVTGKVGGKYLINDPAFGKTTLDQYPNPVARGYVTTPNQSPAPGRQVITSAALSTTATNSSLVVAADTNVELLVVDPAGKRTGFDPTTGNTIQEIASSVYFSDSLINAQTGEPPNETGHQLQIDSPISGTYQVIVTGRQVGPYTIVIYPFSDDGGSQAPIKLQGTAGTGSSILQLQYNSTPGSNSSLGTQSCAWISALSIPFTPAGGSGTIDVSAPDGCPWAAISNANWIKIDSGSSGTSSGKVNYSVSPSTILRTGTISVANQNYSVSQAGTTTPPTLQFSLSNFNVAEAGASATITVTRTGDVSDTATVDYATQDNSAHQRSDYTLAVGTLLFAPGEARKDFTVLVTDDAYFRGDKVLNLVLSNPTKASLGNQNTATLTILDNDTGTASTNPLDNADARFLVRQQYYDFLSRLPEQGGFDYWSGQITQCGADPICILNRRIAVSNAFFYELEFQQTGSYVFRLYRAAFGNNQPFPNPDNSNQSESNKLPGYAVFARDRARVVGGANLAQGQLDLANVFVTRPEFLAKYPASQDGPTFVDALLANIKNELGVDLTSQRTALINLFNSGGRGGVIYRLVDDNMQTNPINNRPLIEEEYNRGFVFTQYAGYLRRDSDIGGFLFWLGQVNRFPVRDGNAQHAMVCSFITSAEYQQRFSPVVTHSNSDCPQ